jgi:hypothetical protein
MKNETLILDQVLQMRTAIDAVCEDMRCIKCRLGNLVNQFGNLVSQFGSLSRSFEDLDVRLERVERRLEAIEHRC